MLQKVELEAIEKLKADIASKYALSGVTLFGSKARGDDQPDSDIDLLILLNQPVTVQIEEDIFDMAYTQELACSVVFGVIVYDQATWDGIGRQMPLRWNIDKEGIAA